MTAIMYGFLFEVIKMFYNCADSYTTVNILKTTDLYTLQG